MNEAKMNLHCWFAALRFMSGNGYVVEDAMPAFTIERDWVFATKGMGELSNDGISKFVNISWKYVKVGGWLCLGVNRPDAQFPKIAGSTLMETAIVDGHHYRLWRKDEGTEIREESHPLPDILVFRDGNAIGDALQAAAVAMEFKLQNPDKRVALMVKGGNPMTAVENTPNIDLMKIADCIGNDLAASFITFWESRVPHMINLDWSVEGELLKYKGRRDYWWTHAQRKAHCGKSYNQNVATLSGLKNIPNIQFFAKAEDEAHAATLIDGEYIAIQLRGSAVHKWYPFMGEFAAMAIKSGYKVVLLGEGGSLPLELAIREKVDWLCGETKGLVSLVGKLNLGQSVSVAKRAQVVIGPETGLMVALCHEPIPKVLLVSHSAPSNFDDWNNIVCVSGNAPCWPCHRHHDSHDFCPQDKASKAAACQAEIPPAAIMEALKLALDLRQTAAQPDPVETPDNQSS
jgi:ADP-heptose:LPS heptosyltransferase